MRFTYSPLNSIVIGFAAMLAAVTLNPMIDHPLAWSAVLVLILPATALGAIGAAIGAPRILTILAQLIVLVGALVYTGLTMNPAGDAGWLTRLIALGREGIATVQTNSAPLPLSDGVMWLVLVALALVMLIIELLVNGLEQPAWSIAPIGVLYGIGAVALPDEMPARYLLLLILAYGSILLVATGFHNHRASGPNERIVFVGSRLMASVIALALAAGLTLALTPVLPMGPKQPWLAVDSSSPIELSDPTVALSENLQRPAEQQVLRYTTSTEQPTYLRTVALTRLTTEGAVLSPMRLATAGLANAYDYPGERIDVDVEMDFVSEYLPAPFAVDGFSADGQWAFDPNTMSVIATGEQRLNQTEQLSYSVRSVVPSPQQEVLESLEAGSDPAGEETLEVPAGLDIEVTQLTNAVTSGAQTAGAKAIEIQRFLRSPDFEYSLLAPQSADLDTISAFLLEQRSGYCIHFAASMVTMARIAGIPARMAIGFTSGTPDGEGGYVVTTHNMHAWPELYFEELGWIPFEPTPSVGSPPEWTDPDEEVPSEPSASPSPEPTESEPNEPAPPTVPAEPSPEPTPSPAPEPGEDGEPTNPVGWIILVAVALLAVTPAGARWAQRAWRLRDGQPGPEAAEGAWREVRASLLDAKLEWPDGSPVRVSARVGRTLSPEGAEILAGIAGVVERSRYARGETDVSGLANQVRDLRRAVFAQLPGREFTAKFLPASLIPRWLSDPSGPSRTDTDPVE